MTDTGSRLTRTALLASVGMFALALVLPVFEFIGPMPGWLAVIISAASLLHPSESFQRNSFFTVPQKLLFSIGWLSVCASIAAFVLLGTRARRPFPSVLQIGLLASLAYAALIPVAFPHASLQIGYFMWVSSQLLLGALSFKVVRQRLGHGVAA